MLVGRIREGLGRLAFAAGPLVHVRPFLGPTYSWVAACPRGACLPTPTAVRLTLKWIGDLILSHGMRSFIPVQRDEGELFRMDAKAEGDLIVLGGWTTGPSPSTWESKWFSQVLKREEVPWAFAKGEPFRVVASLELLAVVFGLVLLVDTAGRDGGRLGRVAFSVGTDNQGNSGLVRRWMTTKWPLCAVAMELSSRLTALGLDLQLDWRPRTTNVEADALTNQDFSGFDLAKRVNSESTLGELKVMNELLSLGSSFESSKRRAVEAFAKSEAPRRVSLRLADPW